MTVLPKQERQILEYYLDKCIQIWLSNLYPSDSSSPTLSERESALLEASRACSIINCLLVGAGIDAESSQTKSAESKRLLWCKLVGFLFLWDDCDGFKGDGQVLMRSKGVCEAASFFSLLLENHHSEHNDDESKRVRRILGENSEILTDLECQFVIARCQANIIPAPNNTQIPPAFLNTRRLSEDHNEIVKLHQTLDRETFDCRIKEGERWSWRPFAEKATLFLNGLYRAEFGDGVDLFSSATPSIAPIKAIIGAGKDKLTDKLKVNDNDKAAVAGQECVDSPSAGHRQDDELAFPTQLETQQRHNDGHLFDDFMTQPPAALLPSSSIEENETQANETQAISSSTLQPPQEQRQEITQIQSDTANSQINDDLVLEEDRFTATQSVSNDHDDNTKIESVDECFTNNESISLEDDEQKIVDQNKDDGEQSTPLSSHINDSSNNHPNDTAIHMIINEIKVADPSLFRNRFALTDQQLAAIIERKNGNVQLFLRERNSPLATIIHERVKENDKEDECNNVDSKAIEGSAEERERGSETKRLLDRHASAEKISWSTQSSQSLPTTPTTIEQKENDPPNPQQQQQQTKRAGTKTRKTRKTWTQQEVNNLIDGYRAYGHNWALILRAYAFADGRTNINLKDKARQLIRAGVIKESE